MKLSVSRIQSIAVVGLLVAGILLYLFVAPLRAAVEVAIAILTRQDPQEAVGAFRDYLLGFGVWAPVVSAGLMVFQSIAAPLPAFVVTFANGLLFGWGWGAVLSWTSAMLGAVLCFWIARALGRPAVERLVGGSQALETADLFIGRYGNRAILVARLLPFVSFDIISYGAGLTSITWWRFLWATGLGQLPATLVYSYLGEHLTGSVKALFWVFSITLAIVVVGSAIGPHLFKRPRSARANQSEVV